MANDTKREHRGRHSEAEQPHGKSAKRRRPWRLIAVLAMLAAVVWLLPGIVAHTPLLRWVLKLATADIIGSVAVESASLGWFSPVAVRGVAVNDAAGKPVLTVTAAGCDRTLAGILWNYTNLGQIRLEGPKLSLVLRDDGSNVEDLLAKYIAPKETKKPSAKIALSLEIVDGGLSVTDQGAGRSWQVQKLTASVDMQEGVDGPLGAKLSADLPDDRRPGKLAAGLQTAAGGGEATLSAEGLPLAMFRAIAARFAPGTTLAGQLSSELRASWSGQPAGKNTLQAELSTEAFSLTVPMLQGDVVQLERLQAGCQASWQKDRVEIEKLSADCDLGNVSLASTVRLCQPGGFSWASLAQERHELSGRVDLARLARLLPATLRLRRQVEINSGEVRLIASSRPEQQGMKWHGQLDAANLTATAAGRQIAWQRPLSLALDAHQTPGGPAVDALRCESDFLKLQAAGTPDELTASLSFNLKQLADELGQFVDLGGMQLAGDGWGNLNWKRSPQRQFEADAAVRLGNFQLALPNQPAWRENELRVQLSAKGQTDLTADTRIDSAALNVTAGDDRLDVTVIQPIKNLRQGGAWPIRVQAQGQLQNWPGRLAAWLPMKDWRLTGGYTLEVSGTASDQGVELSKARLTVVPLVAASTWLNANEPQLDVALAGSWNRQQRRLQIEPGSLTCATAAIQANNVLVSMPENGPLEMAGTLKLQGDAARIRRWFADPQKPSTWQLAGQLSGTAQLQQASGMIRGETTVELANLAVVDSTGQQFQEPRVRLTARGGYDRQAKAVQVEQCELASGVLAANVTGRIAPAGGENNAQLSGQIGYDLERLAGLLRPYIGSGVRMVGRGFSPAWYRGPFSLAAGQSAAGCRWEWANVYGFRLGPGELKAAMADGAVRIEPLDLAVGRGRLHLAPAVRLAPDPMELSVPKGPLAQQIEIDPAMCASLLKYVAPVLADVATAEGTFSIDLDGCRIPLKDPAKGELAGRLTIHSVAVGPGPLVRALAVFLGRESPAKLRQESVVQFRMVKGRVYHQGLELVFPEFTVRTHGSVGLDQSLAIMAEMPVPPKWLESNTTLSQAMRNQTIRVPVGGTLSKPELDKKVMETLSRQFLQKAAENIIEGELNKQLDRLFGPRK